MFVKQRVQQYVYSSAFQYIQLKNGLPALSDASPN
jgi:hypothetical protein